MNSIFSVSGRPAKPGSGENAQNTKTPQNVRENTFGRKHYISSKRYHKQIKKKKYLNWTSIVNDVWFQYLRNNVKGSFMHNGSDETFWELLTFLIWENRASAKVEKIFLKYVQGRDICNNYF